VGAFFSNSDDTRFSVSVALGIRQDRDVNVPTADPAVTAMAEQAHLGFYVFGKLYASKPKLEARADDHARFLHLPYSPYRASLALAAGTNPDLGQIAAGVSFGHVFDRLGVIVGGVWHLHAPAVTSAELAAGKSVPRATPLKKPRPFLALEYSF
jgi:hypothetical protein